MQASSTLLAQIRPANTSAATAFETESIRAEITRIIICNTTGVAATFSLYHDDGGTSYSEATALFFSKSIPANDSYILDSQIVNQLSISPTGSIGVQSGTASALTFNLYGITSTEIR